MTIQEIGAIGEFVSGIAVLITLIYLSMQVRQFKADTRRQITEVGNQLFNDISIGLMTSPELAKVRAKAQQDYDSLEPYEIEMLEGFLSASFSASEAVFDNLTNNSVSGYDHSKAEDIAALVTTYAGAKQFWKKYKTAYGEDFANTVDKLITKTA